MTDVDPEVRAILDWWATVPATPVGELTAAAIRRDDLDVLALQRPTGEALTRVGAPPSFQVLIYPMLDATASSASYEEFATGYGFSSAKSRW